MGLFRKCKMELRSSEILTKKFCGKSMGKFNTFGLANPRAYINGSVKKGKSFLAPADSCLNPILKKDRYFGQNGGVLTRPEIAVIVKSGQKES
jgi:hypothetical protein